MFCCLHLTQVYTLLIHLWFTNHVLRCTCFHDIMFCKSCYFISVVSSCCRLYNNLLLSLLFFLCSFIYLCRSFGIALNALIFHVFLFVMFELLLSVNCDKHYYSVNMCYIVILTCQILTIWLFSSHDLAVFFSNPLDLYLLFYSTICHH